ncbi:uncharacterized protein [Rutidosis leptorrhynchoides]|uniref:uncharacterized protein n=1 Tax=Rutidosis leptorrhynchoides TaxID=125765 RepID=UPI003A9A16F1
MDNGFNDRVSKLFGSITPSSSTTNAPWSLTNAQVERKSDDLYRYRNKYRGDDDETPVSSSFFKNNLFNNRQTDGDGDGDGEDDCDDIRSSIGLDPTLDYEEEEDAYDKIAEGRENGGDRLFMKDVTHHGPYLNSHNILPTSTYDVKKDPRANHDAAKTRLKQDDDDDDDDEPMLNEEESFVSASVRDNGITIKSILKRKNNDVAQPRKLVRFDPNCKNHDDHLTNTAIPVPEVSENMRSVPDYIMNPSKYTRYELHDSSHYGSNSEAYLEFLEQLKNPKHVELEHKSGEPSVVLPISVAFIPRKMRGDAGSENERRVKQLTTQAGSSIGIAVVEVQQGESEMQEDELIVDDVCVRDKYQKPGRRYRSKMEEEDDNVC